VVCLELRVSNFELWRYAFAMRIIFMGSGEFGLPTLRALAEAHEVALVVTQPDRPAGRSRQMTPTPIGQWAEQTGTATLKPANVNAEDVQQQLSEARADVTLVIAFGQYIRQQVVDIPRLGTVNLHGSLLPKYRGAAPINWAMVRGEQETGNTVIRVAPKMDAGEMLGHAALEIDSMETASELHDRLAARGPDLALEVLAAMETGTSVEMPQDEALATAAPKLSRADGWVDFAEHAHSVRCRVHGLTPWPGVSCTWREGEGGKDQSLLLRRLEQIDDASHGREPGMMIDDGVIACGQHTAVRLLEVQPPGKRVMSWADYTRGKKVPTGAKFSGK
jgi:methionyl-tRNA formyltransferase